MQTLHDHHVKTDRQTSSAWFYLSGDPHKKTDRRRSARWCYSWRSSTPYFRPSLLLTACFVACSASRPLKVCLPLSHVPLACIKTPTYCHFPFCRDFLTVIIQSVHLSQLHRRERTVYTSPEYKILSIIFPFFSTEDTNGICNNEVPVICLLVCLNDEVVLMLNQGVETVTLVCGYQQTVSMAYKETQIWNTDLMTDESQSTTRI
jgi:hypothetical protein